MNDFKSLKRKLLLEFGDAHIILSKQLNALQSVTVDDLWFDRKGQIVYIEGQIEYLELFHAKLSTTVNFVESCGHTSELGREFYRKLQFEKVLRILGQSMVKLATNCSKKLSKQIRDARVKMQEVDYKKLYRDLLEDIDEEIACLQTNKEIRTGAEISNDKKHRFDQGMGHSHDVASKPEETESAMSWRRANHDKLNTLTQLLQNTSDPRILNLTEELKSSLEVDSDEEPDPSMTQQMNHGASIGRGTGSRQSFPGNGGHDSRAPNNFDEGWKGVRCFVCDLTVPKHSLGTCAIAMKKTNKQRASIARKRQVCYACLRRDCLVERVKANLTENVCNNFNLWVSCEECKKEAPTEEFCYSALICIRHAIKVSKPLKDKLQRVLGTDPTFPAVFITSVVSQNIENQANGSELYKTNRCNHEDHPILEIDQYKEQVPEMSYNTWTGDRNSLAGLDIIEESSESTIYFLQVLTISKITVLCFFDDGAQTGVILGNLAHKLGLKCIDKSCQTIVGAGDRAEKQPYGRYRLHLGPVHDKENQYQQMTMIGMNKITSCMPAYELSRINKEVREYDSENEGVLKEELLPVSVGGIIIGIKTSSLLPREIFSVPGGLIVARSALRDSKGSNIVYGGTHKLLSEMEDLWRKSGNVSMTQFYFFNKAVFDYRNSVYDICRSVTSQQWDKEVVDSPFIIADEDGASSLCLPIAECEDCHEERLRNKLEENEAVLKGDLWEANGERSQLDHIMTDLDFQDFSCPAEVLCILSCLSYLAYLITNYFCDI